MDMKSITLIRLLALFVFIAMQINSAKSQEKIEVKGIVGEAEIVGRISEEEARRSALNNAKVEALRRAGVGESIQSYENLFRSEVDKNFTEFFTTDIQTELQGAIQSYEIVDHRRKVDPVTNLFMVEVTINATVILYSSKPDPTFSVKVEGIKGIYDEGELLEFSIFATQNCYLHIFSITDNYTILMYPNFWEKLKEIPANKKIEFPFEVTYELFKSGKGVDTNRLIFVFTKEPIKYLNFSGQQEQITTAEPIFTWIYSIMPDQRKVDYHVFTVR
jgi:hypothetical protein